ncbi:aldo/keto reductase [Companilactobacillus ginsenosidimutans]|uniref:2,5-diketo-D-gluconic acid reductase n=1 Tax=Companilactobacillus ginsenosidimutans TaxID=1007676 RepID=A0A0H4QHC4_9LACO|nr:aldo/keto reductase [Companilactobacillus ginsenosidimutans]AKP67357.1 2,5-diketo-D-gluconic acid reductase [Companilactobacillus ginsenosidimutans]
MTKLDETYTLNNGLEIPKVAFGTWQMPAEKTRQSVLDALEAGYRHIDTALAYGNEKEVGQAVRDSGIPRDQIYVTSKLPGETKTYEGAKKDFETTFNNLDIDYLDLYLIHAPFPWQEMGNVPADPAKYDKANQEIWKAMEEILATGKVKSIGVSNFNVRDMKALIDNSNVKPAVDQIQYYVGYTEPKISAYAKENDILVEAYSPLATGRMLSNPTVERIAEKYKASVAQLAIQFVIQNGALPLPKATHKEHILDNAKLDFKISEEDMEKLNSLSDTAVDMWHNGHQE